MARQIVSTAIDPIFPPSATNKHQPAEEEANVFINIS
jgi:hypothetical protein